MEEVHHVEETLLYVAHALLLGLIPAGRTSVPANQCRIDINARLLIDAANYRELENHVADCMSKTNQFSHI